MTPSLLVVAGEASGDRAAAAVVRALWRERSVRVFGLGGPALAATGADLVADLRQTAAMGVGAVARKASRILRARAAVLRAARRETARVALLVNYSDFNATLAPELHRRGVHVVWYGAPQVWAWRRGRMDALRPHIDRLAVMLPFEEALWRAHGVDAHYVGHPAWEVDRLTRPEARHRLGLTALAPAVALLPGSRAHEVRALLEPMLTAVERVRRDRASIDTRLLLASSLDRSTRAWARELATGNEVLAVDVDAEAGAGALLPAFDVALTASGTAALEATLARAVPVVAYRVGLVTELSLCALLRTPHVALPNVLLGRAAFTELLQRDVTPRALAGALVEALDRREALLAECAAVDAVLGDRHAPSHEVARMLLPWLASSR